MKFLLVALCACLPLVSQAADLSGIWVGPGQCFLDQFGSNPCQVTLQIQRVENKLNVEHCSQDIGSVVQACFIDSYTIQNENELWLNSPVLGGLVKVGTLSANEISVHIAYPGQSNRDSFTLADDVLTYVSLYEQEGTILFHEEGKLKKQ